MPFRAYEKLPKWAKSTVVLNWCVLGDFCITGAQRAPQPTQFHSEEQRDKEERGRRNTQQIPNACFRKCCGAGQAHHIST